MMRFHFMNNRELDNDILKLCGKYKCDSISILFNKVLFRNVREYLMFTNHYCHATTQFRTVKGCRVNRKISRPDVVYHSMKLCHKELNTYSIALIWRSLLIMIVECFASGGLEAWEEYKARVVEMGIMRERRLRKDNRILLRRISSVHIPRLLYKNISKIGFYTLGNEFMGYLRC